MTACNTPLVTIYIVTYNRESLLRQAVKSVQQQTYKNIEIIVVDDSSTDSTQTAMEMISDNRIRYFRNDERKGACFSRNVAISNAKGILITGLDDDDYFSPNRVEKLVKAYDEKYSLVCSNLIELSDHGIKHRRYGHKEGVFTLNKLLNHNLIGNQVLTSLKKMRSIDGFDEKLPAFQDYDTWVRLVSEFGDGYKIPDYTYYLNRKHDGERITSSKTRKKIGFELFHKKHSHKMTPVNLKSMEIIRYKLSGEKLSFLGLLKLLSIGNYKSIISLYLKQKNLRL